jgi:N-methylhydantoinase A
MASQRQGATDMRYGEQICEITAPLDGVDIDAADLIERVVEQVHPRHKALYTYGAPDQEVVLVNTRLAVVGELPMLPTEPIVEATGQPTHIPRRRDGRAGL